MAVRGLLVLTVDHLDKGLALFCRDISRGKGISA